MLRIDSQTYESSDLSARYEEMERMGEYRNPEGKRYAVCVHHAFDLLTIVMYLRNRGGSVLLIHGNTPVESAKEMASNADCRYLIYSCWNTILSMNGSRTEYMASMLQYTSGTTGKPKLIARTWTQIGIETDHYNLLFGDAPKETPIILVPVSHSYGLIAGVLTALERKVVPVVVQEKNPKFALHAIKSSQAPIVYTVPFHYGILNALDKNQLHCHKVVFRAPLCPMSFS